MVYNKIMTTKLRFTELTEEEFRRFVKKCPVKDFLQSFEMYRRYVKMGREVYLVGVKKVGGAGDGEKARRGDPGKVTGGKIVAGALVEASHQVLGRKIFNAPRGFLLDFEAEDAGEITEVMTGGLRKFLRAKKGMILEISPKMTRVVEDGGKKKESGEQRKNKRSDKGCSDCDWPDVGRLVENLERLGYKNLGEYEQVKWIYTLETRGRDLEKMKASFRKGHKLSIRYATERYGVTIRELGRSELQELKEVADAAGVRHGFKAPEVSYFEQMRDAFGKKVRFLVSEMEDPETGKRVVTSGAMFVIYGGEVIYLFSGSREEYKKYGGPHLMQWKMIQYAAREGLKYNFYGTHPGDGVHAFKTGFRGQLEEMVGTFMLPLSILGRVYLARKKYAKYRDVA